MSKFAAFSLFVLVGVGLLLSRGGIYDQLEDLCRENAELIVHDPQLWQVYLDEAEQNYQERAARYPDTGRIVTEYAPSFTKLYGEELSERPNIPDGEVTRRDIYIVYGDVIVAQYVNYYAASTFAGRTVKVCVFSYPELYDLQQAVD